jgi:hypothetical protein
VKEVKSSATGGADGKSEEKTDQNNGLRDENSWR